MDARLTDEQHQLAAMADEVAADIGTTQPAELEHAPADARGWKLLADTGLLGLRAPESAGGVGAGGVEVAVVCEALGRRLARLPLIGALCATELVDDSDVLDGIVSGEQVCTIGVTSDLQSLSADRAALVVGTTGAARAAVVRGDQLTVVDAAGWTALESADLTRTLATVELSAAEGRPLAAERRVRAEALLLTALAADMVGVMDGTLRIAVDYAKQRVQFDRPIGSFQAIQQLAAAQLVSVEGGRGLVLHAGWALDNASPTQALAAARTAKAYCSEAVVAVCEAAIQILGGIGMTWEHIAHIYLRRGLFDRLLLGDEHRQWAQIADERMAG